MTKKWATICVVDDNPSVCRALERLIKSVGYQVKTFISAQAYLEHGPKAGTDLLVLDVHMPGLNGLELQSRLAVAGSNIPIIFMTADTDRNVRATAMEEGAMAFLYKPFDDHELLGAINTGIKLNGG